MLLLRAATEDLCADRPSPPSAVAALRRHPTTSLGTCSDILLAAESAGRPDAERHLVPPAALERGRGQLDSPPPTASVQLETQRPG